MLNENANKTLYMINGFRFHQQALETIRTGVNNYQKNEWDKPLHPSAVAMYITLFSECDAAGMIDADVSITSIAKKAGLNPSTGHNGFQQLREYLLVKENLATGQYEISRYAEANKTRTESAKKDSDLNYFKVPNEVFSTNVISSLVNANSARGLILLLELCNHFSRDFKYPKQHINENPDDLKMSTLKEKLKLPAGNRVRKIINLMNPIFNFQPEKVDIRKPQNLVNRIRKAVEQIHIRKYYIYINPACVMENTQDTEVEAVKAVKDAEYRFKALSLKVTRKERNGAAIAYHSIVKGIAKLIDDKEIKHRLLRDSMQSALENLETYIKEQPGKLKSIGAYVNKNLQEYVLDFLYNLDSKTLLNLGTAVAHTYSANGQSQPFIWTKFQDYKKEKEKKDHETAPAV